MMLVVTSVAVALVVFILYALDRKARDEQIEWGQALKLTLFGGVITSGVVFAVTSDSVSDVVTMVENIPAAAKAVTEDMFVGTPSF
jgi:predicted TIM-barrel enzyme